MRIGDIVYYCLATKYSDISQCASSSKCFAKINTPHPQIYRESLINYFEIDEYTRQSDDYCVIAQPPAEILTLSSYIMKGRQASHKYPEDVVAKMSDEHPGRVCTDFIANRELCLIVSERVKTIIDNLCGNKAEYLPLSIINHKGRIEKNAYYYINPIGAEDVLNYKESDIEFTEDHKVVAVDKFVFDSGKLEQMPKPLFRVQEWPKRYFVGESLVQAIQQNIPDVTNLNLVPIKVVKSEPESKP